MPQTMPSFIDELRRENLRQLIRDVGSATKLAKKLGHKNSSYITHWLSNRRPISEKAARGIEEKLLLPLGWMDFDHSNGVPPSAPVVGFNEPPRFSDYVNHIENKEVDLQLYETVFNMVVECMKETLTKLTVAKFEELLAFAYGDAVNASRNGATLEKAFIYRVLKLAK